MFLAVRSTLRLLKDSKCEPARTASERGRFRGLLLAEGATQAPEKAEDVKNLNTELADVFGGEVDVEIVKR